MTTLTLGMRTLLVGDMFGRWRLRGGLTVRLQTIEDGWLADTMVGPLAEYGVGPTEDDAVADLVSSLGDLLTSYTRYAEELHPHALAELTALREYVEEVSDAAE